MGGRIAQHVLLNADRFAEYAHDKWSYMMMQDGWSEGSNGEKLNPDLKPFNDLDSEVHII